MIKVLFVCLGNICRSPTAEGVFRALVEREDLDDSIFIDSAGTHAYHIGSAPDDRAQQAALHRGIDLSVLRGRQATSEDIERFDYVLAMDHENHRHLLAIAGSHTDKVRLLMQYATGFDHDEVPDPYYGGANGFEKVLDMIEDAARGLLDEIRSHHDL